MDSPTSLEDRWQFWIDVGGTFTDCVARSPEGRVRRSKVLSSAVVKGTPSAGSTPGEIHDPNRAGDIAGFWTGYRARLLDARGRLMAESVVTASIGWPVAAIYLRDPWSVAPSIGQAYELVSPEEAPILAIRSLLQARLDQPIPPCAVRLGTTKGTNALLTRRGARTALVATRGLGDMLRIGYQERPRLFELNIRKPAPLYAAVAEIDERIAASGDILQPLAEAQARTELIRLKTQGIESLAVCLMNAYANPAHELALERIARELDFEEISVSHRVSPLMKIVPRGGTTVLDAYLNPVLRQYVARLH
jgi:5-oxoprolinase (ATP-hydrolysing)